MNIDSLIFADSVEGLNFREIAYFWPESDLLTIFVCGAFFYAIGWVMQMATEMKEENEAII